MPIVKSRIVTFVPEVKPATTFKKIILGFTKLIAYLAFVAVAVYYTPKILSKKLGTPYPLATITSGSMWPVLQTNDLILMKGISGSQAQVGQIIVYKNAGGFTIHRLIRRENGKLITKGDANDIEDKPVAESEVVGRAVYIKNKPLRIPYLGMVAKNVGPGMQKIQNR